MTGLLALALLCVASGFVVLARVRDGEFLTPESAFASAWSITFGLYLIRMLPYGPMPWAAAAALALGAGSLLAGIRLGRWCCGRIRSRANPMASAPTAWLWGYGVLGLLGLAWYLFEVHRLMGVAALWRQGFEVRMALNTYRIPSHFLFLEFFCVVTPLVAAGAALAGRRIGIGLWLLVAACAAGTWAMTDRTQFFTVVLGVGFMYAYRHGPALGWKRLAIYLLLSGGLLLASFLIVGQLTGKSPERMKLTLRPPLALASSASPATGSGIVGAALQQGSTVYLYATGSFAAFATWYPGTGPRTYGLHSAYPLFRALEKVGLWSRLPPHIPSFVLILPKEPVPVGWNGYTLLYYPILDFGISGMIVYCLLVGVFCGAVYQALRAARASPARLLLVAQVTTALVLSMFVNKFNNTAWWYVLACSIAPFVVPGWIHRWRGAE